MSKNQITKEAFATSLKELLCELPLEKISVKDITEHCNLSRNSFYYHFKDKYELINWIFYSDISKETEAFHSPSKFLANSFVNVCSRLYQERAFYLSCFKYVGQNSLFESLYELYYDLWKENLHMMYSESAVPLGEEELEFMAKINTQAIVGVIADWVKNGMHDDYADYYEEHRSILAKEFFVVAGKYIMIS